MAQVLTNFSSPVCFVEVPTYWYVLPSQGGVTMQLSVRSGDAEVSELVASAVAQLYILHMSNIELNYLQFNIVNNLYL